MRRSGLFLIVLSISLIFHASESRAWWWQGPKIESSQDVSQSSEDVSQLKVEEAEKKILKTINQRLEEQIEELSTRNQILEKEKRALEIDCNRVNRDRQDLLEKLKDYTAHRQSLDSRIRILEAGIINLNDSKKKLAETNRVLSEEVTALSGQIVALEKKLEPLEKIQKNFNKRLDAAKKKYEKKLTKIFNKERKKYQRQIDKLDTLVEKLEGTNNAYLEENGRLQGELDVAMKEVLYSKNSLKKLEKEVAAMHYNLGVIFNEAGDYNKALREYKKVLEVAADDADTHYNMAVIYDTYKKNRQKAIYHYKMYLKIRPNAEDAAKVKEWITEGELENKIWEK